jgi:hypothetical protein
MSALPPKADICIALAHVRFVPKAEIATILAFQESYSRQREPDLLKEASIGAFKKARRKCSLNFNWWVFSFGKASPGVERKRSCWGLRVGTRSR